MYKIYYLRYEDEIIYVGLTTQDLKIRKGQGYKYIPHYKDCDIFLIEETDDRSRERFWIDEYKNLGYNLINKNKGEGLDRKEYHRNWEVNNKEKVKLYRTPERKSVWNKSYSDSNKDKLKKSRKEYYEANKEQISIKGKAYREDNKGRISARSKEYYQKNKERIKQMSREYYQKNKEI